MTADEPATLDLTAPGPPLPGRTPPRTPTHPTPELPPSDLSSIPGATWHEDTPTRAPARASLLTPARAGIYLGTGRDGQPVTLPCPGPEGSRIAVLGEALFGRLIALRLLAAGAVVTAATREPWPWQGIRHAAGGRLLFTEDPAAWPRHAPAPPGIDAGPQALVSDQSRPPASNAAVGPWRTVLHVARTAPRRAAFWHRPAVLLALDARHAEAIGRLLGPEAAHHTARLAQGEIILFRPHPTDSPHSPHSLDSSVSSVSSEVLRTDISPGETALLTPGHLAGQGRGRPSPGRRPPGTA